MYGRRVYEIMSAYWPRAESDPNATPVMLEFARIWNATPRYVFSTTLDHVEGNSRLVRGDVGEVLAQIRCEVDGDIDVAGPTLASAFVERGLVDAYRLVIHPVILGAGTPFFPRLEQPIRLRQVAEHRFAGGAVYIGYETVRES
jgi:dihydrofolate reductase